MTRKLGGWAPLALAILLAIVFGGQVPADVRPLAPGLAGLWVGFVEGEAPAFSHALVGLLILGAFTSALAVRRVVQLPAARLASPLALFLGLLVLSILHSSHRAASVQAIGEWAVAGCAFFGAVALSGRVNGPRILAGAVVAGCTWLALKGLVEYGQMRPIDPSWRIFAGWVNANALAGILLIGLPIALGFALIEKRLAALASGGCASLIALALLLTQSKGGLLLAAVGVVLFAILAIVMAPRVDRPRVLGRLGACAVVSLALGALLMASQRSPAGQSGAPASQALARVSDVSDTQAQSFTFRKMLWQGAVEQVSLRPMGTGIGTYRFHSAETGRTPQTHLAHESYLQLATEASPIAVLVLVIFGLLLLVDGVRRTKSAETRSIILRLSIVSALVASAGHGLIDSDLYHFGILVPFFALAGVLAQLSADAVTPEFLRPGWRGLGVLAAGFAALALGASAASELSLARLAYALSQRDPAARDALDSAKSWAAWDGETWRLAAVFEPDASERLKLLDRAATLSPTPRNYRALAREQASASHPDLAEQSLRKALELDPNNLAALAQRLELRRLAGDVSGAEEDALALIAIESMPYFQVRALPEIVPTETFSARIYLAGRESDAEKAAALFAPAVQGLLGYAQKTVPLWQSHVEAGVADPGRLVEAREVLTRAKTAALRLADLYRTLGRPLEAELAAEAASVFDASALGLPST